MSPGEWSERSSDAKPSKRLPDPDRPPEPSPIPPYVPPKRTKYDDLVDVLADGLFEMVLNGDVPVPTAKRKRRPYVAALRPKVTRRERGYALASRRRGAPANR